MAWMANADLGRWADVWESEGGGYLVRHFGQTDDLVLTIRSPALVPEHWEARPYGILVGYLTPDDPARAASPDPRPQVGLRMRDASRRPLLSGDEFTVLVFGHRVTPGLLHALRSGHRALLAGLGSQPQTLMEAADRLAEVMRLSKHLNTQERWRAVKENGHRTMGDWLEAERANYDRVRCLLGPPVDPGKAGG